MMQQEITTAAPESTQEIVLHNIPLSQIYLPINTRSTISQVGLESLAESIKEGGLIQPVAVRPLDVPKEGFTYALVAGFRRYAAHQLAGLPTILATIRPMSEEEADIYRVVENLVREGLHPADEAIAVGKLTNQNKTTDEICAYLGKNAHWVTQRRAISGLLPEWLTDLREDLLTLGAAEELSRWPHDVQRRCLSVRRAGSVTSDWNITNFVRRENQVLGSAPWVLDDAELFPAAGACTTCPKRSSCNALLFAELADEDKDNCLDGQCWKTKLSNHIERVYDEQLAVAGDAKVMRLSTQWYGAPEGALKANQYEVSKRKKGTVAGVYVDGPQAGKPVRVLLTAEAEKAVEAGKTELSQGEKNRETRQKRLLKEAKKRVLADRSYKALLAEEETAAADRINVLAAIVAENLTRGRNIDLLTLGELARTWGWAPVGKKGPELHGRSHKEWVLEQVHNVAPTEEKLVELLLFSVTHKDLGSEYTDYQQIAANLLGEKAQLLEGLEDAGQVLFEQEYDPRTLRARKEPVAVVPHLTHETNPVEETFITAEAA